MFLCKVKSMAGKEQTGDTQAVLFPAASRKNLNCIYNVALKAGSVVQWLILSTHIKKGSGFTFESPWRVCIASTCQCGLSPCTQFYKVLKRHAGVCLKCVNVVLATNGMI